MFLTDIVILYKDNEQLGIHMLNSSFLKWAGGKNRALGKIFETMPREGNILIEPFVGSGSVSLNTNYKHYVLNDNNPDLINTMLAVVKDPKGIIAELSEYFNADTNTQDAFIELRRKFNVEKCPWERAKLFIYLNRHCYNGLCRYNNSAEFNTSFGRYSAPLLPREQILFFSKKLKKATFTCGEFDKVRVPQKKSVIYCDPPYVPDSKTANFTSYTKNGFGEVDHIRLNVAATSWQKKGSLVFISNSKTDETLRLYSNKTAYTEFEVRRSISHKGENRGPAGEVLLVY